MPTTLENLQMVLHGVTAPFACGGTCFTKHPVQIVFADGYSFAIVPSKNSYGQTEELAPLLDRCDAASFGDGKRTRYDTRVRNACQLKADPQRFTIANFDPMTAGVLQAVQQALVPHDPNPITAEFYGLNIYPEGGHFAPHKDTPRGADMFGSLVVCLPAAFHGGNLKLCHRGVVRDFDWGKIGNAQAKPLQLHWAAFFGDVEHQIERVWGGARVTLTYLLRRGAAGPETRPPTDDELAPLIQHAWHAMLADPTAFPDGGILAYPCCHLYHQDARFQSEQSPITRTTATVLKGRDHLVAASALAAGLEVTFNPYMFENIADEVWQLSRFPTAAEKKKLGRQMDSARLEKALPIAANSETEGDFGVTWLEPPPTPDESNPHSKQERLSERPLAAHLHSCDYCPWGYFGNESSEVDLYTYAALHIAIPPVGQGTRRVATSVTPTTAKRPRKKAAPTKTAKRTPRKRPPKED